MLSARSTTVTNELNVWILNETVWAKLNETWRNLIFNENVLLRPLTNLRNTEFEPGQFIKRKVEKWEEILKDISNIKEVLGGIFPTFILFLSGSHFHFPQNILWKRISDQLMCKTLKIYLFTHFLCIFYIHLRFTSPNDENTFRNSHVPLLISINSTSHIIYIFYLHSLNRM